MSNRQPYIPINCSFYDYLEEAATLGKMVIIEFVNQAKINVFLETLQVLSLFIGF